VSSADPRTGRPNCKDSGTRLIRSGGSGRTTPEFYKSATQALSESLANHGSVVVGWAERGGESVSCLRYSSPRGIPNAGRTQHLPHQGTNPPDRSLKRHYAAWHGEGSAASTGWDAVLTLSNPPGFCVKAVSNPDAACSSMGGAGRTATLRSATQMAVEAQAQQISKIAMR